MPRYRKSEKKPDRPFKRRYKTLKHKALTHVLANIPQHIWEDVQKQAKTHKGRTKILPSSLQTIQDTKTPRQFNAKLAREEALHDDHTQEFHKGGGLGTAINSVFSSMWDLFTSTSGGAAVGQLFTNPEYGEEVTDLDRMNADVVQQAYNQDFSSRAHTMHGWVRVPKFDSPYVAVYFNPATNDVYCGVRGSISAEDWLVHDMGIVINQHPGEDLVNDVRQELVEIVKEFPDATLTLNSHSLGGALTTDVFLGANAEDKTFLDDYDQLNYFNAGSSPMANLKPIQEMLTDGRVKLFINKSDLVSQTYNQERHDDTRVSFAEASWNPLVSHGMSQWSSDDQNFDTPVDWGPDPQPSVETAEFQQDTSETQAANLS